MSNSHVADVKYRVFERAGLCAFIQVFPSMINRFPYTGIWSTINPDMVYYYPEVPISNSFHSMASRFQVTGRFETSTPNDLEH